MQTATFKYEDKLELMSLEENGEISFKTGENKHNFIVSKFLDLHKNTFQVNILNRRCFFESDLNETYIEKRVKNTLGIIVVNLS